MSEPVVEIHDLDFSYNGQPVLRDINLEIKAGDFMAMIGPNGGGKTTLLKILLGLYTPDKGKIHVLGRPPRRVSYRIGYVPHNSHINQRFPISALDVVLMGLLNPGKRWARHSRQDRLAAYRALEAMQMRVYGDRRIGELSGGQRQRVFIARALVTQPRLLLLDEPTASIDTKGQAEFFHMLKGLNRDVTIMVVSHDLLVISTYVKSVACVNKRLHHHHQAEITGEMMESMYPCTVEDVCPVELVAHGLPHRVLKQHED